ncbi:glutamate racemase [Leptospira ryugenii]|uniref:Glutamate racemase n=1 Tax=Leptospira ryugenii TaxID=1917863 RepID=A0A2P2E0X3_9LEPT|nr:glutamate racemase [Leptospira ryugenii]
MGKNGSTIGLFDSGLGGLSVLKSLYESLPDINYIYFADLFHGPYGHLPKQSVLEISQSAFSFLKSFQIDAGLIACNSATSVAVEPLRKTESIPVFGMEPAVKPAAMENPGKTIAVFATSLTLKEEKFNQLVQNLQKENSYLPVACEGLAKMIDQGAWEEAWHFLEEKIRGVLDQTNIIVLGCTHYVFLKEKIQHSFPNVKVYDGNLGTAMHIKNTLSPLKSSDPTIKVFLNSDNDLHTEVFHSVLTQFLPKYSLMMIKPQEVK